MTYLDYYEQGPEVLLAVLLFNLVVTIFAYGLFPFVFARVRKKSISGKKYKRICYGFNAIPMIWFFLLNRRTTLMPYLLWTSVFVYFGTNKLERRSVLAETDTKEKIDTELTIPSHTDGDSQITSKSLEFQEDYVGKYQRSNSSESTNIKSDLKQRYCKHCGGAIDSETKKCSKCGKQYFRLRINWGSTFAFTITVLAIAIAAVSLYRTFQYQNEITLLKDQQALLQNQVDELKSTVYDKNVKITKLEKQIEDKNLKYTRLLKEKQDLQTKVEFYDDCVVFVLDDGTNRYHRYDCVVFKYLRDSFWAFNIEAAKSRGYQACFACD